jgi:hypothetical protein
MASSFTRFLDHTQWRITVGRTPLDGWSARRRDLYLTTNNTHNRPTCPRWNSNPQSRQARSPRPTPYSARPSGPAQRTLRSVKRSLEILLENILSLGVGE